MSKSEPVARRRALVVQRRNVSAATERRQQAALRRTQSERSSITKRRILNAAAQLIVQKGYAELRVADVANTAGVSIGAQLHHFPSKDSLVLAVIEDAFAQAAAAGRRRAAAGGRRPDVIRNLIEDARAFFFSEHFLIALSVVLSTQSSAIRNKVLEISRRSRLPLEDAWRDAMVAAGIPDSLSAELLTLTLCIIRGFMVRRLWDDDQHWQSRCLSLWQEMIRLLLKSKNTKAAKDKKHIKDTKDTKTRPVRRQKETAQS